MQLRPKNWHGQSQVNPDMDRGQVPVGEVLAEGELHT